MSTTENVLASLGAMTVAQRKALILVLHMFEGRDSMDIGLFHEAYDVLRPAKRSERAKRHMLYVLQRDGWYSIQDNTVRLTAKALHAREMFTSR